jgi:hypothetical protein
LRLCYVFAVLVLWKIRFPCCAKSEPQNAGGRAQQEHVFAFSFHSFSHLFTPFPPSSIIQERSNIIKHYHTSSNLQNFSCLSHLEARSARPARPDTKLISFGRCHKRIFIKAELAACCMAPGNSQHIESITVFPGMFGVHFAEAFGWPLRRIPSSQAFSGFLRFSIQHPLP